MAARFDHPIAREISVRCQQAIVGHDDVLDFHVRRCLERQTPTIVINPAAFQSRLIIYDRQVAQRDVIYFRHDLKEKAVPVCW